MRGIIKKVETDNFTRKTAIHSLERVRKRCRMDKEAYARIGIDYEEGVKRFAGNAEMYEKFLQKFLDDPSFQELDQAMKDKDYGTAFTAAHTLKGITGNLSMNEFYNEIVPFVDLLRTGSTIAKADAYYPQVVEKYHELIANLKNVK